MSPVQSGSSLPFRPPWCSVQFTPCPPSMLSSSLLLRQAPPPTACTPAPSCVESPTCLLTPTHASRPAREPLWDIAHDYCKESPSLFLTRYDSRYVVRALVCMWVCSYSQVPVSLRRGHGLFGGTREQFYRCSPYKLFPAAISCFKIINDFIIT